MEQAIEEKGDIWNQLDCADRSRALIMRILYHHRTQAEDAQGIHIEEMVKAFRELGHEVAIVALVQRDETSGDKVRGGLWRWITGYAPDWLYEVLGLAYNLYGYRSLSKTIKQIRPQFIYERYSLCTFCGVWASHHFQIPLVLEVNAPLCHEQDALGRLAFRKLARFSERWICANAAWTLVVSSVIKDLLVREGIPPQKIRVMPNGVDPQKFHPGISGESVRVRYGLEQKLVVGFVGWFRPWHGLEMLLETMCEERLAEQGVSLLLVGDGPSHSSLHKYTEDYGLGSAVIFTGPVMRQEVPVHIAAMDIVIQPSVNEYACPMKILEYMAMRKCILAPDQPNIREILTDGETASLFQPGDTRSLAAKLLALVVNPEQREFLARRASEHVFERGLLWRTNAQKTVALLSGDATYSMPGGAEKQGPVPDVGSVSQG